MPTEWCLPIMGGLPLKAGIFLHRVGGVCLQRHWGLPTGGLGAPPNHKSLWYASQLIVFLLTMHF